MLYFYYGISSVVLAVLLTIMSYKMFQIYQQSSYKTKGVINWIKITKGDYLIRYFAVAFFSFVSMLIFIACFGKYKYVRDIGMLFFMAFMVIFIVISSRKRSKKPLIYTARTCRFIAITFILYSIVILGLMLLARIIIMSYSIVGILPVFIPIIVILAHYIVHPFEKLNNYSFKRHAIKKLASMPGLIKIGITGSYGKTTAKNILAAMLKQKYAVCYSPHSYNTPMGISKVINNDLEYDDEIFIAEMGARNKGDIAELAQIVSPNYGIITAIGNQHLETFGSRAAIIATKFELIQNLCVGGMAVFNGDSPDAIKMYESTPTEKEITGVAGTLNASCWYDNVTVGEEGTAFTLYIANKQMDITTKLLGKHIPSLMALCAVVAYNLGVTLPQIAESMQQIPQVEHRLELIRQGDSTIIDDAYNSNTEGAKNALLLLKEFSGIKIIITPGIVELGEEEKQANTLLGATIADCADYCFLIGSRAQNIKDGALSAGMSQDRIIICDSLNSAVEKQAEIVGKKVILFENDLPDNIE